MSIKANGMKEKIKIILSKDKRICEIMVVEDNNY